MSSALSDRESFPDERPVLPPPLRDFRLLADGSLTPDMADAFIAESDQALWLWHVTGDRLTLSSGAGKALGLEQGKVPESMEEYISRLPPAEQDYLRHSRDECLRSGGEHFSRVLYFFERHQVLDQAFVLRRDEHGKADHILGSLDVAPAEQELTPLVGHWMLSFPEGTISFDRNCARMLGEGNPAPFSESIRKTISRVHQAEHQHLVDLKRICDNKANTDSYTDTVLFRQHNGSHILLLVSASVLTRDGKGHALVLVGSLQSTLPDKAGNSTRLALALYNAGDGMWDWDITSDRVYYSPRYLSMLGYTQESFPAVTSSWLNNIHPDDYACTVPLQMAIAESPRHGNSFEVTYRMKHADGRWIWILGRGHVTHRDSRGRATRMIGMHTDISTTQTGREQLEDLVKRDILTGLCSRTFFKMTLDDLQQHPEWPLTVIAFDLNGLKLINDYLGHTAGDEVLIRASMCLRRSLRLNDCVARTGGDEFIALLPRCSEAQARRVTVEVQKLIDHSNDGSRVPALLSIGSATGHDDSVSVEELVKEADRHMMENKMRHRLNCQQQIKDWIESHHHIEVSLADIRYAGGRVS